jgi:hypothetical protein
MARDDLARLEEASLEDLMAAHPAAWREVGEALVAAASRRSPEALAAFVKGALDAAAPWRERVRASHGNPEVVRAALPRLAAARMAKLAAERTLLAAATGVSAGPVRLGWWSGTITQRLLFERGGLVRKPASMAAFRLLWPLVPQRRLLMPLVQPRGIYCFYSGALVQALAALAGGRPVLEIAAGDGTLSRFLAAEGVAVRATDDRSWAHAVAYPEAVERLGAVEALRRHPAPMVLCSFPPPGNGFEREVFGARHVERYVVITSRHRHAAGDWDAYERQDAFERAIDERLSRLVLPPELDPAVLVFTRKR